MNCKIKKYTMEIFKVIFLITVLYLVINAVLNPSQMFYEMKTIKVMMWTSICMLFIYIVYKMSFRIKDKKKKYIIVGLFMTLVVIQIFFAYYLRVGFTWDFGVTMNTSIEFANGNRELPFYYWAKYPNNIGIVFLLSSIFRVILFFYSSFSNYYLCGILINLLVINGAVIIGLYIIYKKYSLNEMILFMMISLFITPLYSYVTIVYTDTIAMIFPILALLFLIISEEKKSGIYIIISGIFLIIGSFIKTNVIIFFIALIIYIIYKYKIKSSLKYITILITLFMGINALYSINIQRYIPISIEKSGFPATHWIMMGLIGNGGYCGEDDQFSTKTYEEFGKEGTKKANIKVIKERIKKYGFKGYIKFLKKKMDITWNDGTYFAPDKLVRQPHNAEAILFKKVVSGDNEKFVYLSQAGHLVLLIGIFLGSIKSLKKQCDYITFLQIAMFGNMLFLLIWETRSRYLVYCIPIMIFLAIDGYIKIIKMKN